jgi:hypothetical protein
MADHNLALQDAPMQAVALEPASKRVASSMSHIIGSNNFDFCRFWLAVLVIFSHSFALAEGDERHELMGLLTSRQLSSGRFAVCCFFAISGFLISHSWLRSTTAMSFLWKRIKRIYPAFVVAVVLGAFVISPIASSPSICWHCAILNPARSLRTILSPEPSMGRSGQFRTSSKAILLSWHSEGWACCTNAIWFCRACWSPPSREVSFIPIVT